MLVQEEQLVKNQKKKEKNQSKGAEYIDSIKGISGYRIKNLVLILVFYSYFVSFLN